MKTLKGHSGEVNGIAALPNGNLASGSTDRTIKIWNTETGKCLQTLIDGHNLNIGSIISLEDGYIAASSIGKIKIWNVSTGQKVDTWSGNSHRVYSMTLMNQMGYFATGLEDGTIKIWNRKGINIKTLTGHTKSVINLVSFRDGYLASTSYDHTVRIWNINQPKFKPLVIEVSTPRGLAYMSSGFLIIGKRNGEIEIWKIFTGKLFK